MKSLRAQIESKEIEVEKTTANFEALHRDYQIIKRDCENIQRDSEQKINGKQNMIDSIASELDSYAEKLRSSETEAKALRTTVEQLQNVVNGYETRENALQQNLNESLSLSTQGKTKIHDLEGALESERQKLQKLEYDHMTLKQSYESQEQTLSGFNSTIANKNSYISRLEENIRHYTNEHERLVNQLEEAKLVQRETSNEVKNSSEKEAKLKKVIDDHKRYMEQQAMQISTLRNEGKSLTQVRDQLTAERDDAMQKILTLEQKIHKLQVSIILNLLNPQHNFRMKAWLPESS